MRISQLAAGGIYPGSSGQQRSTAVKSHASCRRERTCRREVRAATARHLLDSPWRERPSEATTPRISSGKAARVPSQHAREPGDRNRTGRRISGDVGGLARRLPRPVCNFRVWLVVCFWTGQASGMQTRLVWLPEQEVERLSLAYGMQDRPPSLAPTMR